MGYSPTGKWDEHNRYTYTRDYNLPNEEGYTYSSTGQTDSDGRPTYTRVFTSIPTPPVETSEFSVSGTGCLVLFAYPFVFYLIYLILKSM